MPSTTIQLVQYQGSKRQTASQIAAYLPSKISGRFIEPFAGTAALSIYLASINPNLSFLLNDINPPVISMMNACINQPELLSQSYQEIWEKQFQTDPIRYFFEQRELFNTCPTPARTLFMLGRIVKGSLRYNASGQMNQSCDKRRTGPRPTLISKRCREISNLMKGRTECISGDYRNILKMAKPGDFIYMDPPYQGTSDGKDKRYYSGINFDEFVKELKKLKDRGIEFAVSYDGSCGERNYGKELPVDLLSLEVYEINGGRSAQGTLLGRNEQTVERLYVHRVSF